MGQTPSTKAFHSEDLLAETKWIRNLARGLVRDSATADDVAQETWVVALERPPSRVREASRT